jgi:hypothetical protein
MIQQTFYNFLRTSVGTLSRWSRLHLQWFAPINKHWARVMGYSPFSLCETNTILDYKRKNRLLKKLFFEKYLNQE